VHLAKGPQLLEEHRGALLALYVDQVLGAKERPAADSLAGWAPLAAALTHDDLAATLLPAAQRSVRRSPDSALPSLAALLGAVQLDLSRYVADLVGPLLLLQCRHAKDSVR
jgi:hypothetical protein